MLNKELAIEGMNLIFWINELIKYLAQTIIKGTIDILMMLRDNVQTITDLLVEVANLALLGVIEGMIAFIPAVQPKMIELMEALIDLLDVVTAANWNDAIAVFEKLAEKIVDAANDWVIKESEAGGKIDKIVYNLLMGLWKAFLRYNLQSNRISPLFMGHSIGNSFVDGLCKSLQINSPSKVMEKIGNYAIEGFAKGVNFGTKELGGIVDDIGTIFTSTFAKHFGSLGEVGSNLKDIMLGALSQSVDLSAFDFAGTLEGYMNLNPVITPELDLSNIENGMNGIEDLFTTKAINAISSNGFFNTPQEGMDAVTYRSFMEDMLASMANYNDIQHYNDANTPTSVNVILEGDAKQWLKILSTQNSKETKATKVNKLVAAPGGKSH